MSKQQAITGLKNHNITQAELVGFTRAYRTQHPEAAVAGGFFDKTRVMQLLAQEGASGFRYYYGLTEMQTLQLVLVAATAQLRDLIKEGSVISSCLNPALSEAGEYQATETDHRISLDAAAALTANYRKNGTANNIKGGFFGQEAIRQLLAQEDCIGIRFYFGAEEDGTRVICLMGVDSKGADMFHGLLLDRSTWCPPFCDAPNLLNSNLKVKEKFYTVK